MFGFPLNGGFFQQLLHAGKFRIPFASDNGDIPEVLTNLFADIRHRTDMPESDGKTRGVGRQSQDIEAKIRIADGGKRLPVSRCCEKQVDTC